MITDRINAAVLGLGTEKTVKVTENGQVIERTEPNIEVRIGAIFALKWIAKKNLDVHVQLMELLCTYIRENAKISRENQRELFSLEASMSLKYANNENAEVSKIIELEQLPEILKSGQDIQTAIKVLGRRSAHAIDEEKRVKFKIDMSDCLLTRVSFTGNFNDASFHNIFIIGSHFHEMKSNGAEFLWCNFYNLVFFRVSANDATIDETHFAESYFTDHCEAKGAQFAGTYFTSNDFGVANINAPGVIDVSDSVFFECLYQNTALPHFVRNNTRFEGCSIVRSPTER